MKARHAHACTTRIDAPPIKDHEQRVVGSERPDHCGYAHVANVVAIKTKLCHHHRLMTREG